MEQIKPTLFAHRSHVHTTTKTGVAVRMGFGTLLMQRSAQLKARALPADGHHAQGADTIPKIIYFYMKSLLQVPTGGTQG